MYEVSVIIPCYNHAHFVGQAIASVLEQTFTDFEAIVVDDGSTDETRQVVAAFSDPRIRYLYQPNSGLGAARNTGIRAAQGKYIALLDADDRWESPFLQRMVDTLTTYTYAGAAYCGFRFMDSDGRPLPISVSRSVQPERFRAELSKGCWFVPCVVVARLSCYESTSGFDPSGAVYGCEDYDLWLRMSEKFLFVGIPDILVWHRRTGSNMSDNAERMFASMIRVAERHGGPTDKPCAAWSPIQVGLYSNAYRYVIESYVGSDDLACAIGHLRQALAVYPPLAGDLGLWYRVGCAHQPIGRRGDWATMNITRAVRDVTALLGGVWGESDVRMAITEHRAAAFGYAYLALGLLAYGCRDLNRARSCLAQAVRAYPRIMLKREWNLTFIKSCLDAGLLDKFAHRS